MAISPYFLNRPRKRNNPEGHLQLSIIHYCKASGWVIGKIKNKGSRLGSRFIADPYAFLGLPDLLLFANNKMYFLEIKSPAGRQSPMQKSFQSLCTASGINYILIKSLDDVISAVR